MVSLSEMKICRLCGSEKDANDITCDINNVEAEDSSGTITLKKQISTFFNIRMSANKDLPQSVCQLCRMQIEVSFAFADNMKKVEKKLVLQKQTPVKVKIEPGILGIKSATRIQGYKNRLADLYRGNLDKPLAEMDECYHVTVDLKHVSETGEVSPVWLSEYGITTWNDCSFECQTCLREVKSLNSLLLHFNESCPKTKRIKCSACNESFAALNSYMNHVIRKHKMEHLAYTCVVCSKIFYNVPSLIRHFTETHPQMESIYPCIQCGYCAQSMTHLKMHVAAHKDCGKIITIADEDDRRSLPSSSAKGSNQTFPGKKSSEA